MSQNRLPISLLLLRVSVFIVMLVWTLDKFIRPGHAAGIFSSYYHLGGFNTTVMYAIGIIELIIIVAFLLGLYKRITYGAVFIFHLISTVATWKAYLTPFTNVHLLFFAGIPMLAGCFALYLLREQDTLMVFGKK